MPLPNSENPAQDLEPRPAVNHPNYFLPGTAVQPRIDPVTGQLVQPQAPAQTQPQPQVPPSGGQ
jgi:hypothetical protein